MSLKEKARAYLKVYKYVLYDVATIIISYYLTIWVFRTMGGNISFNYNHQALWWAFLFIIPSKIILNMLFGIYRIISKYASFEDFFRIIMVVIVSNLVIVLSIYFF